MPTIGIPFKYYHLKDDRCILYLGEKMRRCVQKAGGFVLPLVPVQDVDYMDTKYHDFQEFTEKEKEEIEKYLDMVDGVLFPGGYKLTPWDEYLLKRCIERNIPTLGICLGMQMMGGYPNGIQTDKLEDDSHFQESDEELSHIVKIKKDSKLYEILGKEEILVNSFHHYHIKSSHLFETTAVSHDGIIEAVELPNHIFCMGVQWHPEVSYDFDENSKKIIDTFIDACQK